MNLLQDFKDKPFIEAVQSFFKKLNVPVNEITTAPATAIDIIGENTVNTNINEVYVYGIVDDAVFEQNETFKNLSEVKSLKADYDGILLFGITLHPRENNLLPTRAQLADITRAFSRTFKHTPITIVFKYGNHIAFANSERTQFKQQWREGEKVGKVSLLRDIDFNNVHSGHERILNNLAITISGKNAVVNFETLYKYWQEVLSVSLLNKEFYKELSHWYFWAIKEVQFPNEPLQIDFSNVENYEEAVKEHKGKNVIRLLTRILFIWFIKEKNLIPEELFDEKIIAKRFIDDFTPQKPHGVFAQGKHNSKYYRAILQNLFFATLNQQRGDRSFRIDGKHQNATQLMRYKSYLKEPEYFKDLMESTVPFMNGGLFECLDKPHPELKSPKGGDKIIYIDGFSDREDNGLIVPDFLFFDADEEVDLSTDYGSTNKLYKNAKTRGLIAILKSYKFTITENTPIDEDVALDPELLGKVFENLLASYNPETKTTARKQTGSFYTPREIVNYMVEESLIAYLKNKLLHEEAGIVELGKKQIALFGNETKKSQLSLESKIDESPFKNRENELDELLHELVSFSDINPFAEYPEVQKKIIQALDKCTILDPACGSGAYPMGILQKMVHILHKIDPNNTEWKQRQIDRVNNAIEELELMDDTNFKEKSIKELNLQIDDIENSFANNELDYGRKLYLIENCIYGVDIQPIATQISKLRFFISLVVDQKVDAAKENFGIRPLPNLEAKFVAANTLIGIEKPQKGQFTGSLFDNREVQRLENELKKIRHKLFSIKTPSIKRELREQDKILREKISELLVPEFGNDTARLLSNWDPYDQNASSPFYDTEWMFGLPKINGGFFSIVIGNPPYVFARNKSFSAKEKKYFIQNFKLAKYQINLYSIFIEKANCLLESNGVLSYIVPNNWLTINTNKELRRFILQKKSVKIVNFLSQVFESASVDSSIIIYAKNGSSDIISLYEYVDHFNLITTKSVEYFLNKTDFIINIDSFKNIIFFEILDKIELKAIQLKEIANVKAGLQAYEVGKGIPVQTSEMKDNRIYHSLSKIDENYFKYLNGSDVCRYATNWSGEFLKYGNNLASPRKDFSIYTSKRILVRQIPSKFPFCINACLIENTMLNDRNSMNIVDFKNYSQEFVLGILNSKLISFWFVYKFGKMQRGIFPQFKINELEIFPIIKYEVKDQIQITELVKQIHILKNQNISTIEIENKIDLIVYKLYELTYDEVIIIDYDFALTKEDYNNFIH
ncbi:Eco57I restriction-modification methylase domain-containing protein [Flavobacterium sp.]|uniref:Eco57I restriction-modification methylase domain-containing protein n=1 Tax=Flavobacterium sp. TaxID=239 RepID=UPI003753488D